MGARRERKVVTVLFADLVGLRRARSNLVDAADRLGDLGLRPDEAHTRLRAASA